MTNEMDAVIDTNSIIRTNGKENISPFIKQLKDANNAMNPKNMLRILKPALGFSNVNNKQFKLTT
jgi:hypothetical protein